MTMTNVAQLNLEMHQSMQRTLVHSREVRPSNTSKAYGSRQREFRLWCDSKGFPIATRYFSRQIL